MQGIYRGFMAQSEDEPQGQQQGGEVVQSDKGETGKSGQKDQQKLAALRKKYGLTLTQDVDGQGKGTSRIYDIASATSMEDAQNKLSSIQAQDSDYRYLRADSGSETPYTTIFQWKGKQIGGTPMEFPKKEGEIVNKNRGIMPNFISNGIPLTTDEYNELNTKRNADDAGTTENQAAIAAYLKTLQETARKQNIKRELEFRQNADLGNDNPIKVIDPKTGKLLVSKNIQHSDEYKPFGAVPDLQNRQQLLQALNRLPEDVQVRMYQSELDGGKRPDKAKVPGMSGEALMRQNQIVDQRLRQWQQSGGKAHDASVDHNNLRNTFRDKMFDQLRGETNPGVFLQVFREMERNVHPSQRKAFDEAANEVSNRVGQYTKMDDVLGGIGNGTIRLRPGS
jgi:hypothetical protein